MVAAQPSVQMLLLWRALFLLALECEFVSGNWLSCELPYSSGFLASLMLSKALYSNTNSKFVSLVSCDQSLYF